MKDVFICVGQKVLRTRDGWLHGHGHAKTPKVAERQAGMDMLGMKTEMAYKERVPQPPTPPELTGVLYAQCENLGISLHQL